MSADGNPDHLIQPSFQHLTTRYDSHQKIFWCYMHPRPRACFSVAILEELKRFQRHLELMNRQGMKNGGGCPVPYVVFTTKLQNIFNLGGDLELFLRCIRENRPEELRRYARLCVDVLYSNFTSYDLPMTTFILATGDALGGGFEAVLSGNVIVAEKTAHFGLPEILFNMFPGMGAYSLLARRIGAPLAERILLSGKVYTAAEMYEMGVVDLLAEPGEGERVIREYVARHGRKRNAYQAVLKVRRMIQKVERSELDEISDIWVDAAMNLESKDMRLMERLIKAQDRLHEESGGGDEGARWVLEWSGGPLREVTTRQSPAS